MHYAVFVGVSRDYLRQIHRVALRVGVHIHAVVANDAVTHVLRPHAVPVTPFGNGHVPRHAAAKQPQDEAHGQPPKKPLQSIHVRASLDAQPCAVSVHLRLQGGAFREIVGVARHLRLGFRLIGI